MYVFGESPPIPTPKADGTRRGVRQSIVSTGALTNQSIHIHLDMERLFSQRVLIHTTLPADGSADMVMASMYKAVYKSLLESVRVMTLSREAYMVLQANISLLKQVGIKHHKTYVNHMLTFSTCHLNLGFDAPHKGPSRSGHSSG